MRFAAAARIAGIAACTRGQQRRELVPRAWNRKSCARPGAALHPQPVQPAGRHPACQLTQHPRSPLAGFHGPASTGLFCWGMGCVAVARVAVALIGQGSMIARRLYQTITCFRAAWGCTQADGQVRCGACAPSMRLNLWLSAGVGSAPQTRTGGRHAAAMQTRTRRCSFQ